MTEVWDQVRVEQYIVQGTEESLTLDYKAAGSLAKSDGKKAEITKDVSAMANSAGGILIYGVAEYQDDARKHLPEKLDPINRVEFPKEWLEQVISNIQPKIDGVIIHPVPINTGPNHVVYVVDIPQSHTAHQAKDFRYYKRFNFESVMMADYEIRDVMGRRQYPRIELEFEIEITQEEVRAGGGMSSLLGGYTPSLLGASREPEETKIVNRFELKIWAFNSGRVYAQYVNAFIEIPDVLLPPEPEDEEMLLIMGGERDKNDIDGTLYYRHYDDNTTRDIIGFEKSGLGGSSPNYGPARHVPILPGRHYGFEEVDLRGDFESISLENLYIEWEVFADNAPALKSRIAVADIEIIDKRDEAE